MKFAITRESLLKLLKIVSGVVDKRQHNPILANVLMRIKDNILFLVTSDQEVELIASSEIDDVEQGGAITVPFRKLNDLCRALPDNAIINAELQNDRLLIKANRSRFVLATLPAEQFPELETISQENAISEFSLPKKEFKALLSKTAFAMAEQDVRYFLNGMLFEVKNNRFYTVAADGHRLAMNYLNLEASDIAPVRVIVPRKGVLEIMRMLDDDVGEIKISVTSGHIQAYSNGTTITTRLLDGKFPDYERVIPRDGDKVVTGDRETLKEAFNRAAALFSEKFRGIKLRLSPTSLMVLASSPEQDEVEENLEIDYAGQELEVGFNVRYLIDYLSVVQSDVVRFTFSDSHKSTLIEEVGEEITGAYVLMPVKT